MANYETQIIRDLGVIIQANGEPPAGNSTDSGSWWKRLSDMLSAFGEAWDGHPLAMKLGVALFEYYEDEAKDRFRDVG